MDDERKGFLDQLKQAFQSQKEQPRYKKLLVYAVVVLTLGVGLMVFGNFNQGPTDQAAPVFTKTENIDSEPTFGQEKSTEPNTMTEYERKYETELKETLEGIIGVDNVSVMVNLDATESKVYEKNMTTQSQLTNETDREGGKRQVEDMSKDETVVIVRSGDQENPIVVKTVKPTIRGVLIVAKGAENIKVKKMITEAVTKVLDVPVHKVSVLPKKFEEES